jgi:hypothetical protein
VPGLGDGQEHAIIGRRRREGFALEQVGLSSEGSRRGLKGIGLSAQGSSDHLHVRTYAARIRPKVPCPGQTAALPQFELNDSIWELQTNCARLSDMTDRPIRGIAACVAALVGSEALRGSVERVKRHGARGGPRRR